MSDIAIWEYGRSVSEVKTLVLKWSTLTVDLVDKLYKAREELAPRAPGKIDVTNDTSKTWTGYLAAVGLERMTAHRWLERYIPEEHKLLTVEELETKKQQEERARKYEAQTDDQKARERVATFVKTGQKPEGWRRGTDDALAEKEKARAESMKKWNEEMKAKNEERVQQAEKARPSIDFSEINKMVEQHTQALVKRQTFKESIRVSHEGKDDPFVDAIMDYLETLADDNRRMEACYNIIKVCKGIANQLQSGKTP